MAESVASRIIAAHRAGLAERQAEEDRARQAEDRKLQQQLLQFQMRKLKLEEALDQRQLQAMSSGGPTGQATTATEMYRPPAQAPTSIAPPQIAENVPQDAQQLLMRLRSSPVAAQPMPLAGIPRSVETGTPPAFPDIETPYGLIPGTNREMEDKRKMADLLTAQRHEVQKQSQIERAKQEAAAPFSFHSIAPGSQGVIGAGTAGQKIVAVPPRPSTPTVQETTITVDGKGPVRAILVKNDDGSFQYLNPTTRQPITGQIGEYERPRADGDSGMSDAVESNILNRLTTQWDRASAPTRELQRQIDVMDAGLRAARNGDLAQGSQAILVTFQKILDPLSVVRESEYMRSAAGQSLLRRIEGFAEQLAKGGAGIPLSELEKFGALAKDVVDGMGAYQKNVRSRIEATLKRYGLPNELVFGIESGGGGDGTVINFEDLPN